MIVVVLVFFNHFFENLLAFLCCSRDLDRAGYLNIMFSFRIPHLVSNLFNFTFGCLKSLEQGIETIQVVLSLISNLLPCRFELIEQIVHISKLYKFNNSNYNTVTKAFGSWLLCWLWPSWSWSSCHSACHFLDSDCCSLRPLYSCRVCACYSASELVIIYEHSFLCSLLFTLIASCAWPSLSFWSKACSIEV